MMILVERILGSMVYAVSFVREIGEGYLLIFNIQKNCWDRIDEGDIIPDDCRFLFSRYAMEHSSFVEAFKKEALLEWLGEVRCWNCGCALEKGICPYCGADQFQRKVLAQYRQLEEREPVLHNIGLRPDILDETVRVISTIFKAMGAKKSQRTSEEE